MYPHYAAERVFVMEAKTKHTLADSGMRKAASVTSPGWRPSLLMIRELRRCATHR